GRCGAGHRARRCHDRAAHSRDGARAELRGTGRRAQENCDGPEQARDARRGKAHFKRRVRGDAMTLPFSYDYIAPLAFGGTIPDAPTFDSARAVILPIPLESTTSYVPGTRNGPREILVASTHMELWDEETGTDVHGVGIFTMPEMDFPFCAVVEVSGEIRRVAAEIVSRDKFPVVLGGEHSITAPVVAALAAK